MPNEPLPPNINPTKGPAESGKEFLTAVKDWFHSLIDLEEGLDRQGTIDYIKNNKRMEGANAWMLMCSIMIASLGLDLNSPAVIIGAMLISPLMSPILGVGLGVGINDKDALYLALRHFGIALLIALVTSTVYFWLTPFGDFTKEIAARTQPTLLDGLVAIFGGFAGIISVSRKDKSNAIPGVAIATALMPPVCVSGYGLANGDWATMLSAFYLFFLNSFFIAVTTFLIIRFLRFPYRKFMNKKEKRRTQFVIVLFSILMVVPSAIILYNVLEKVGLERRFDEFQKEYFSTKTQVIDHKFVMEDSTNVLFLTLVGESIHEEDMKTLEQGLEKYHIHNTRLALIQDSDVEIEELNKLKSEVRGFQSVSDKFDLVNKAKSEREKEIEKLKLEIDSLKADTIPFAAICQETKVVFKDIEAIGFAKMQFTDFQQQKNDFPTVLVQWNNKKRGKILEDDEEKLREFIKLRANLDTVQVVRY